MYHHGGVCMYGAAWHGVINHGSRRRFPSFTSHSSYPRNWPTCTWLHNARFHELLPLLFLSLSVLIARFTLSSAFVDNKPGPLFRAELNGWHCLLEISFLRRIPLSFPPSPPPHAIRGCYIGGDGDLFFRLRFTWPVIARIEDDISFVGVHGHHSVGRCCTVNRGRMELGKREQRGRWSLTFWYYSSERLIIRFCRGVNFISLDVARSLYLYVIHRKSVSLRLIKSSNIYLTINIENNNVII